MELAGGEVPETWKGRPRPPLPGRSLVPAFRRDVTVPRDFLWWCHSGNRAIRAGDSKLVSGGAKGHWELYDLRGDRCESRDLAERHPDRVRALSEEWAAFEAECRRECRRLAAPAAT